MTYSFSSSFRNFLLLFLFSSSSSSSSLLLFFYFTSSVRKLFAQPISKCYALFRGLFSMLDNDHFSYNYSWEAV
jgi:hypothetical protein